MVHNFYGFLTIFQVFNLSKKYFDNVFFSLKPPITFYTSRLTSGVSRDGILMIRVPKRVSPERIIPIQYDARITAVKNAIQQTVQNVETEMTAEEVHQELLKENIAPLTIEKEEDAVQAASAEVIEAMTIGVAEEAGAEVIMIYLITNYIPET